MIKVWGESKNLMELWDIKKDNLIMIERIRDMIRKKIVETRKQMEKE